MSRDKPVYAFRYSQGALVPDMAYDAHALDGLSRGDKVRVEIKQWRNLDRLRAYWATLQDCVDATACAPTKEALDAYVRVSVGHVDTIQITKGGPNVIFTASVPRPINTRECEEPEMIAFFNAANELLAREFGYAPE